jgi:hypothetical protein
MSSRFPTFLEQGPGTLLLELPVLSALALKVPALALRDTVSSPQEHLWNQLQFGISRDDSHLTWLNNLPQCKKLALITAFILRTLMDIYAVVAVNSC